jgi:putative oligomerization/nucleic acid binding protein
VVVIFGWGAGEAKDLGEIAPTTCPNCRNQVFLHHIRTKKQVSLYFIPMASYGGTEYLSCPICRHGIQLGPHHQTALRSMRSATTLYRKGGLAEAAYRATVARFWAGLGMAPSGQQVLQPAATIPPPATREATRSLAAQLEDLGRLHADGVLTAEEFAAAKRRLLDS